eukprot:scaffold667850_cov59-Prasinocladus_malaysianus.AAC.1
MDTLTPPTGAIRSCPQKTGQTAKQDVVEKQNCNSATKRLTNTIIMAAPCGKWLPGLRGTHRPAGS